MFESYFEKKNDTFQFCENEKILNFLWGLILEDFHIYEDKKYILTKKH